MAKKRLYDVAAPNESKKARKEQRSNKRANQTEEERTAEMVGLAAKGKQRLSNKRANQTEEETKAEMAGMAAKEKQRQSQKRKGGENQAWHVKRNLSNLSEEERVKKKQDEIGSRFEQDRATRKRDEVLRRYRQRFTGKEMPPARAAWPPVAPERTAPNAPSDAARLDTYISLLSDGLVGRIHTCPNCKERDVCHGVPLVGEWKNGQRVTAQARAEMKCWRCETKLREVFEWRNGLDLNLDCEAEEATGEQTSSVPLASRQAWRQLVQKWGSLTVLEEALISRVSACTSVLKLPTDQQLGYTSSVINYINDTADVAQKLPRAPKDSNIVVYQTPNAAAELTLQRVRKHAVREYLFFFAEHHPLYREGIVDPMDNTRYLVRPFMYACMLRRTPDPHTKNFIAPRTRNSSLPN